MGEQDSKDKVLIVEKRLIMNSVGEIIATNRKRLGWSQTELAERLQGEGFNQTNKAISKWEKNDTEPSVTIFLRSAVSWVSLIYTRHISEVIRTVW